MNNMNTLGNKLNSPDVRRRQLKQLLGKKNLLRVLEVHNGLSAIKANNICITHENEKQEFDALWISSFTDSAAKGQPDAEIVSFDSRLGTISQVTDVTTKPIIVDGDTGGPPELFDSFVKRLYNLGVSAVVLEDQLFPKRNSLDQEITHKLENPSLFAKKLSRGKRACPTEDFLIFARIESFIAGLGLDDALRRVKIYLEAGADGIFIHSKKKTAEEVIAFAQEYEKIIEQMNIVRRPLICVPTTYNCIHEKELLAAKFNIVIYANHMLRAAHKAMEEVASSILTHGRAQEAEQLCTPVKVIFEEVGFEELKKKEEEFFRQNISVIIPAAGNHRNLGQLCATKPCSLLPLGKKTVIEYQIQELKKMGIRDIIVVRGNHKEKIQLPDIRYYDTETQEKGILATIFAAEGEFTRDLLLVYSDVLFTQELVKKAMARNDEIVIVIDASYRLREGKREGRLDYVMTNSPSDRKLVKKQILVSGIGKEILPAEAHAEFIGITYLSKAGAEYLRKLYHECKQKVPGEFHEAPSFEKASLTDLLLEAIMRGYPVTAIEVHDGWRELQTPEDYQKACLELGGKAYEQIRK